VTQLHRLAAKQLGKFTRPDGSVDVEGLIWKVSAAYEELDADRRRTDRSIALMIDELQGFNEQLENLVAERTAELEGVRHTLEVALDNIHHGIMMIDGDRRLLVCNRRAIELLDLSPDVGDSPDEFRDSFRQRAERGELAGADAGFLKWMLGGSDEDVETEYQRVKPDGSVISVRHQSLPDGSVVRTFTDVTGKVAHETALRLAEEEYRGLFENAVFGIYRTTVDGRLLRANAALARLNGYSSAAEMCASYNEMLRDMFVDRSRREEFMRLMREEGRVTDFVAEIFRHGTGERVWISQNAWTIRDGAGNILYYEGSVVDTTERKKSEARVAHLAHHDLLTDLPNRTLFHASLEAAVDRTRRGRMSALCYIDLDRFKEVNDALGHLVGDQLLSRVARRLRACVRQDDVVARLGGDEFAIIQGEISGAADARALAERVIEHVSKPYRLGPHRVTVGVSIGMALTPVHGVSPQVLINNADLALYRAKSEGGQRYRIFDDVIFGDLKRTRTLTADLREALKLQQFEVFFQPIVDLNTSGVIGFESLLRWTHPELGSISPSEFIPLAEETGLIIPICDWVLRQSCSWIASIAPNLCIAVNISAVQFRRGNLRQRVLHALAASGLDPRRLTLEITETAFIDDDPSTMSAMRDLRAMGVKIVLDDFGTGYSSLTYLQKFLVDGIKIDKVFTSRIDHDKVNAAAVRAIIALGQDLHIPVVAEGVETQAEADALMALGCERAQGYLFGRPAPGSRWFAEQSMPGVESDAVDLRSRYEARSIIRNSLRQQAASG
jgi:diguanylate cyclase (GGDEF)-like protein/PAS domain S-box-containing protein